ncbi:MAG: glycosyltransferase family 4 protein [Proteobacteria bacterium]|nr:glycosyltransferase family 4 protein [Pseudomonadota bacterium]
MKLLIDGRKIGDGGIGVYIENLIDGLLILQEKKIADIELSVMVGDNLFHSLTNIKEAKGNYPAYLRSSGLGSIIDSLKTRWNDKVKFILETSSKYSFGEYFMLPYRQKKEILKHDVYHSPHYTLPFGLGIPSVVTIHDLIHFSHPEIFYHRPIARQLLKSAIKRAGHIITVSHESERQIRLLTPEMKTPLTVVPNSLRASMKRRTDEEIAEFKKREFFTRPFFLFVGNERPHKGFPDMIQTWKELSEGDVLQPCPDLVVVGKHFSQSRDKVSDLNLDHCVRFLGEVSCERLDYLYSAATAVLVPSKIEGFGLPALESLAMSTTVICSDIPALREVCADAAIYAKKGDTHSFAVAIIKLLENRAEYREKIKLGNERVKQFSVEECALKTWNVYTELLGGEKHITLQGEKTAPPINREASK